MARNQSIRLRPIIAKADEQSYVALQSLSDYAPSNPAYVKTNLAEYLKVLHAARQAEINLQNALDAARDATVKAEWNFHNAILGVKAQVLAQYGDDSDQAQALGLKKKSERKKPVRTAKPLE